MSLVLICFLRNLRSFKYLEVYWKLVQISHFPGYSLHPTLIHMDKPLGQHEDFLEFEGE